MICLVSSFSLSALSGGGKPSSSRWPGLRGTGPVHRSQQSRLFTYETGGVPAYAGSEAVCAIALGESPDGLVWPLCREESACPVAHIDVRTFNHTQTHQNPAH
jgi:hypothetical protein